MTSLPEVTGACLVANIRIIDSCDTWKITYYLEFQQTRYYNTKHANWWLVIVNPVTILQVTELTVTWLTTHIRSTEYSNVDHFINIIPVFPDKTPCRIVTKLNIILIFLLHQHDTWVTELTRHNYIYRVRVKS